VASETVAKNQIGFYRPLAVELLDAIATIIPGSLTHVPSSSAWIGHDFFMHAGGRHPGWLHARHPQARREGPVARSPTPTPSRAAVWSTTSRYSRSRPCRTD